MKRGKIVYEPTRGEEVANAVTHGVMSFVALAALPFAAVWAYTHDAHPATAAVSVSIFVISILLMLLISTLYHAMRPASRHREVLHVLDHICIYIAIAGSYTPVALLVIGGWQGWLILALQWTAVVCGVFYKSFAKRSIPAVSLAIYLVMGWTLVFFLPTFVRNASVPLSICIAVGGVFYTLGAWVYARKGFRYHHMVWHLMINLAVVAHYVGIVFFLR